MATPVIPWKTSPEYPMGRTAEFVMAVLTSRILVGKGEKVLEYVTEAEHPDGDEYWLNFDNLSDALTDFDTYNKETE